MMNYSDYIICKTKDDNNESYVFGFDRKTECMLSRREAVFAATLVLIGGQWSADLDVCPSSFKVGNEQIQNKECVGEEARGPIIHKQLFYPSMTMQLSSTNTVR
jgi:hypothetical protein